MRRIYLQLVLVVVALTVLDGCAYRRAAPEQVDAAMKEFPTRADAATIYVYRTIYDRRERGTTLFIDGQLVGNTRSGTYFRLDVVPARHVLHGASLDAGELAIYARPGHIYYVRHEVVAGHSRFSLERDDVARDQIRACCRMLTAVRG